MIARSSWSGRRDRLRPRPIAHIAAVAALGMLTAACGSEPPVGPETGDPCANVLALEIGNAVNGSLTSGDCRQTNGRYGDLWSLRIPRDMTVRIALSSPEFDTFLELRDAQGRTIDQNDDAAGTPNSILVLPLSAGDYRVVATSFAPAATGSYRVDVQEAVECEPVGTVSVGETVQATLTTAACYWEYGTQADTWSLTIASEQDLRIVAESDDFDEGVLIRDSGGAILYGAAAVGGAERAQFDVRLVPGSYSVLVTPIVEGMTGSYTLSVLEAPECGPGTAIELDQEVSGALTDDDCAPMGWGAADSYTLELESETALDFVLKAQDYPPVVVVLDADGTEVVVGYEYTSTGTATARAVLSAGSYEVLATSYDGGARGEYRLTVSEVSCAEPGEIRPGDTVTGTITDQDCLLTDGRFRDSWSLVLDSAATVQIDLTSASFDAYLVLRDADGAEIATDDDSGSGTNSRIVEDLEAGTYEVLASTWGGYQFGGYQLEVTETTTSAVASSAAGVTKARGVTSAPARSAAPAAETPWWRGASSK